MGLLNKDKSKVVEGAIKLAHNIRGMVDDKNFTPEEKSRTDLVFADHAAKFAGATLSENTERSKTRRTVAVEFLRFFMGLIVFIIGSWKWDEDWAIFAKDLVIEFKLPAAFIMIMAFFFGGYYLDKKFGVSDKIKKIFKRSRKT